MLAENVGASLSLAPSQPGLCPCRPRKNPLFIVDLVLDTTGVHYSTPLEQFETSLLNLFDKGILATHAVPHLEKVGCGRREPCTY